MPGRPKRCRVKEAGESSYGTQLLRRGRKMRCQKCFKIGNNAKSCSTSVPISNGPTLITDNSVPTSGTSNQENEIFYQLRSRDVVNLDTRAPTITTPPSQPIVEGQGIFTVYSNFSKAHSTPTIGGPSIPTSTFTPNFGRLGRKEKQILQGIGLYTYDRMGFKF
ncbi:hypothetical protein ES332_D02G188300v1 [Gossypium tomentosum]|uniref:Uncharacterized protein n=1 Tax=Gossypium tomentosum TaxID=34277 RepID=A0A5D2LYV8_GOSTO|nr:hypothetical protein ES332_D02G188300v1 [Gossypium tomentosum]